MKKPTDPRTQQCKTCRHFRMTREEIYCEAIKDKVLPWWTGWIKHEPKRNEKAN